MRFMRGLLSWVLALFLIAVFLQWTIHPLDVLTGNEAWLFDPAGRSVFFGQAADRSGYDVIEPMGRQGMAIALLFACFCLIIPPIRRFGALISLLACLILFGAQLSPLVDLELPVSGPDGGETDDGAQFYLSLACFTASFLLCVIHPGRRR